MTEDEHQEQIFKWIESNLDKRPELDMMYANMNGVRRSKQYTSKLKRRGMKCGIPDMFLPVARWGSHGLYIELKRPATKLHRKGTTSTAQKSWIKRLIDQGYAVKICYGSAEAIQTLQYYLDDSGKDNE